MMELPEGWLFLSGRMIEVVGPDGQKLFAPAVSLPTRYGRFQSVRLGQRTFVDFREAMAHATEVARSINARIERTLMEVE